MYVGRNLPTFLRNFPLLHQGRSKPRGKVRVQLQGWRRRDRNRLEEEQWDAVTYHFSGK
jgi:hypothetical protein